MTKQKMLKMKFAGRFIDLLGHQMYGGAVPAIAEFVANAWDADATKVDITIPNNATEKDTGIIVRDYGEGMTFDELNDFYLNIGYERRRVRGERTKSGRLVMGRKGIGKLAGFGIAEDVILRSVKEGRVVQFALNYTKLKSEDELDGFEFEPEIDDLSSEETGVAVILKNLKIERNINEDSFRKSLARRFALNTDVMQIFLNGQMLTKEDLMFEYKIPPGGNEWAEENIDGFGKVKYWFGFLKETVKDKELRGISIFARDRIAQSTPFFFNLSGGINGQVGLEYLTGQVKADILDEAIDYIATHRQTVNWQFGSAPVLEEWGQNKIKELCRNWKKRRVDGHIEKFKHDYTQYYERIEKLPGQEKQDLLEALGRIAEIERIDHNDFKVIANSMLSGVERESVRKIIKKINVASDDALEELINAVKEWDIVAAVSTAELVKGKIEIIKQFDRYIEERLPEKKGRGQIDMQVFIKEHPWLLGHEYEQLTPADFHHEHGIDKWIQDVLLETDVEFNSKETKEERRFDLLCIKNDYQIVVIELMRPGSPADYDHVMRLNRYVTRIASAISGKGTQRQFKNKSVLGLLIADRFQDDASLNKTIQDLHSNLDAVTWNGLFETVQSRYRDFFDLLKVKAPEDPRIKGLVSLD
ncbi:MAG: hypothetical protein STSR0002_03790 [Smithella sp.]|jgi:hypothetical protein